MNNEYLYKLSNYFFKLAEEDDEGSLQQLINTRQKQLEKTIVQPIVQPKHELTPELKHNLIIQDKKEFQGENKKKHAISILQKFNTSFENPYFFMHFTDDQINKGQPGINTKFDFANILGIYGYPVTDDFYKLETYFGTERKYIFIYSISTNVFNINNYSDDRLEKDIKKLQEIFTSEHQNTIMKHYAGLKGNSFKMLLFTTHTLTKSRAKQNALLRQLGYTNFYDPGTGIINFDIPYQSILLDPSQLVFITKIDNPFQTGRDW